MSTTISSVQRQAPLLTVHCKKCHSAIVFPQQVLDKTSHSTNQWHDDAVSAIVVCRICDSKSAYSMRETENEPATRKLEDNPLDTLWRVKIVCGEKECTSIIEVFTYAESYRSHDDIVEYIMHAKPKVYCDNGHVMQSPSQVRTVEMVRPN